MMRLRRWHASAARARAYAVRRLRSARWLRGRRVRAASSDFTLLQRARAPGPQLSFHWTGEFAVALGDVRVALYQIRAQQSSGRGPAIVAARALSSGAASQRTPLVQRLVLYKEPPAAQPGVMTLPRAEGAALGAGQLSAPAAVIHPTTRELPLQSVVTSMVLRTVAAQRQNSEPAATLVRVREPGTDTRRETFTHSATHAHSFVRERSLMLRSFDHTRHSFTQLRSVLLPLRVLVSAREQHAAARFAAVMQSPPHAEGRATMQVLVQPGATSPAQVLARAAAAFPSQAQPLVPVTAPKPQLDPPAIERITTTLQKTMAVAVEQSVHREIDRKMRAALGSRRFRTSIQSDLCNEIVFERERLGA